MALPARTDTVPVPSIPLRPAPWWRRWPTWAPGATAAWGVAYALAQTLWAATGTVVPMAGDRHTPAALQLLLAALALLAAAVAPATARPLTRRAGRAAGIALAVLIPALGWMVAFGGLAFGGLGWGAARRGPVVRRTHPPPLRLRPDRRKAATAVGELTTQGSFVATVRE
ncbi:hypothetical protein [Streptomyces flavofungini]|uniref:hypothetical protein n=1 Tax=Streptomyces flavofungini TaxID=68200 RepID=UPI0025AFC00D|nr:hypothetical protein [Streptomyces flavofungini]WJV50691.1 hypothetical protein QUY26_37435 [Streptomyces flavofungini]